ncbi:FKBP-type peptidyl-prolyl cis-trans isomerase [Chitinophaga sp. 30R24]|uniref:FKBP-type peptidyl-prolyl cis-trans isomerase n=1 Tax=Chitinophaga sp. 30R24 TaxID=3248838 RepID=UPI003B8F71BA
MKRFFLLGGLFLVLLAACTKKDNLPAYDAIAQYDTDSAKIVAYLAANNITDVKHDPRGIFYQIINRGDTKDSANAAAFVTVAYKGTLLDKTMFDSSDSLSIGLNQVIQGWTIGVPKIGKGGEINLFLPSIYGYGPNAGRIPANSVLIFNVKLKNFVNR